jgi:glycerol kinase
MDLFLGIDQSTSGTKALLFTVDGELLSSTSFSHQQIYPVPGWVEHDAEEIYQNLKRAVSDLLQKNPEAASNLIALSITNQRETFVLFERGTGRPLYNAIVWQCRRGEPVCRRLIEQGYSEQVREATGLLIDTYFPASKITWLLEERPDLRQKLEDGSALVGTIDAYLIYRLTGGRNFMTDHTNASRTLLYDINQLNWHADLCKMFGVPLSALPAVHESSARFGETNIDGILPRQLPISGIMGDSQAALFAQRCFTPGSVKVTFGTGSSILMNTGSEKRTAGHGIVTALAWVMAGRPTYAFEGITNFTGATIQWLRDQLQLIQTAEETEALALSVADNGGVYLVPAFVGLSAPYWRPEAQAGILGLTPAATRAHVVRAALESIAYIVNDALQFMSSEAGIELHYIHADGGAVRNRFLMQFMADISGLQVRAAKLPELSALGAVLSGGFGMGIYHSIEELQKLPADFVEYSPAMDRGEADHTKAGWSNAVQQILHTPRRNQI